MFLADYWMLIQESITDGSTYGGVVGYHSSLVDCFWGILIQVAAWYCNGCMAWLPS